MNAKRLFFALALILAMSTGADAQGWLNRLKDKAVEKVKSKVENKVENAVGDKMDDVLDGKKSKNSKKSKNDDADYNDAESADNTPDAQNQKSDFVRGSVILFEDDFAGEQMGEFPSKWDISDGSLEVASVNGKKYAHSNA